MRRDASPLSAETLSTIPEDTPDLAMIETDSGHIHIRQPGHGPGVHLGDERWRGTKNACLIRAQRETFDSDPQPDPTDYFFDIEHVAKITETSAVIKPLTSEKTSDIETTDDGELDLEAALDQDDWRPRRLARMVVSNMFAHATLAESSPSPLSRSGRSDISRRWPVMELVNPEGALSQRGSDSGFHSCAELPASCRRRRFMQMTTKLFGASMWRR